MTQEQKTINVSRMPGRTLRTMHGDPAKPTGQRKDWAR